MSIRTSLGAILLAACLGLAATGCTAGQTAEDADQGSAGSAVPVGTPEAMSGAGDSAGGFSRGARSRATTTPAPAGEAEAGEQSDDGSEAGEPTDEANDAGAPADEPSDVDAQTDEASEANAPADHAVAQNFSFFVTSLDAMQRLSGSENGFGGDLGGLEGADAICQSIAEGVGAGDKTWRAFLSVTEGPDGEPVNAIDRIGDGPWYDANGRLVASSREGLLGARPDGDPQTVNDLPDEYGVPLSAYGDSHDILTGSDDLGRLYSTNSESTCLDWTSSDGSVGSGGSGGMGRPGWGSGGSDTSVMCGHSWPRGLGGRGRGGHGMGGDSWISSHAVPGCAAGVNLRQDGGGHGDCVGCAGGYGAIYCFAETPRVASAE